MRVYLFFEKSYIYMYEYDQIYSPHPLQVPPSQLPPDFMSSF